jgi:hypothetical protein
MSRRKRLFRKLKRDEHFARVIIHFARSGERVSAVAGSSHAVKLDAALRATLLGR